MEFNDQFSSLTERQKEVLEEIIKRKSDEEIATFLKIQPSTVRKHIENICSKLNIRNDSSGQSKRPDLISLVAKYQPELLSDNKTIDINLENINPLEFKNTINWPEILNPDNLSDYLKLRQNATEKDFELDIYVPLGLVERKEQQRRPLNEELPSNQIYQLEKEITRKFEHQEFLDNIGLGNKPADDHKNIAIIGEPGAGKTTLLEKIAHIIHKENKGLPICISLANLAENQTIKDYLENKWLETILIDNNLLSDYEVTDKEKRSFKKQFNTENHRKVWLLLDGLDEMKATSPVAALTTIKKYINESYLSQAQIIITCRVNVWDASITNALSDFTTYRNLDFTDNQRDNFIREWFKRKDKNELGNSLIEKLQETGKERICELVKNPLRLVLLCRIWTLNQGELPETTAHFYQRYLPYFYNWKKEIIDLTNDYETQDQLHEALGKLAKQGIESESRYRIKKRDAYKIINKDLLDLADRLGWLNIVDRNQATEEPVYAFYHPTFQEYFAALAIDDWDFFLPKDHIDKPVGGKKYRIFEPKWKEVILLWMGRTDIEKTEKEKFIKALVEFKDGCNYFYLYRAYFLAAIAIDQFKDCLLGDEIVDNIVKKSVKTNFRFFSPIKNTAEEILLETDRKKAISALIDLISSSKNTLHWDIAVENLGKIGKGNKNAVSILLNLINISKSQFTHAKIVKALGKIGKKNKKAISTLINLINSSNDEVTSYLAADSLSKIDQGNKKVISTLIDIVRTSKSPVTQYMAKKSLSKIDPENEAIAGFIDIIRMVENPSPHDDAENSLEKIETENKEFIASLIKTIYTPSDIYLRDMVVRRLGEIGQGNPDAITVLIDLICTDKNQLTNWLAANSLEKIIIDEQMTKVIKELKEYLSDESREHDRDRFESCYHVIWKCAQTLTYPEFYQAWHS